ncbi:MAG: DUF2889 domain-containing protein [Halieaceae bacterium]|nr:DUF2889 domain-containing protein [Halieaceae bacterium]
MPAMPVRKSRDFPQDNANPNYGEGCYRRRIGLKAGPGHVVGELEDDCHGFRLRLEHDGAKVTGITGETPRIPMNTCSGALRPLRELIGLPLNMPAPEIVGSVDPRSNCTHLYDLALLAMAHVGWDKPSRIYDVVVDDQPGGGRPARAEVFLDGESMVRWEVCWTSIVTPAELRGKPIMQGFSAWANQHFHGLEKEAAFVLSKGIFVGMSRRYDMSKIGGMPALYQASMMGVCYSYSEGVVERAVRLSGSVRDFSRHPEQLLKFT